MWKPSYASVVEFRDWLRARSMEDNEDDAVFRLKLSAASRALDATCSGAVKRQFGKVETLTTRTYGLRWSRTFNAWFTEIDDLMDTTGLTLTVDGTEIDAADYKLRPRNAIADGEPYTFVLITASITDTELDAAAWWGWNPPWPDPVKEATLLQASRLNIRRDSPYGIAGGSDSGAELRLLERLDPDIAPLVTDYVRTGWVAR